ncbi:GNAT family N-acetyltransferase [Colwellia sp. D2M02]|uniref:GNAT family N-acetyltransferase n=1 Tax=Colwellia sp. D2M02 TaxID=2841562 RepID=UPI002091855C|nr:GNAT family N-acetyltransferase [Colwellia sp. D2M02]
MKPVIRHLESLDNPDIFDIYSNASVMEHTSQLQYLSTDTVASLFNSPQNYTLVAEHDSKVVGHVTVFQSIKVRAKHCASLAIAVHPEIHGKGIGKALMNAVIDQSDNWLNITRLELEVHKDNLGAISLYKRMGFEIEGTKRLSTFKSGKYIDTVIMSRINPSYQLGA